MICRVWVPPRKSIVLASTIEFVSVTPWSKHGDLDLVFFKKKSPVKSGVHITELSEEPGFYCGNKL
jgi:hypothetical protein